MGDDVDLTPCPFCGGHVLLDRTYDNRRYYALCLDCNMTGPDYESAEIAIGTYTAVAQVMEWCRSVPHEVYEDFANAGAAATGTRT